MTRNLYLDIECVPREGIDPFLPDPGDAPSNYRDPVKIEAYREEQRQAIKARAALDPDLAQVVCLGFAWDDEPVQVLTSAIPGSEADILWQANQIIGSADRIVGFALPGYDLRVLSRRALLLGVEFPQMDLTRYRFDHRILDLQAKLSFGDGPQKGKTLDFYCRLFGVTDGSEDTHTGAEVGALILAGDWAAVELHCRCDVERVRGLARRLGYVRARQPITA